MDARREGFRLNESPAVSSGRTGEFLLKLSGRLDAERVSELWNDLTGRLREACPKRLVIDLNELESCDGAGLGLIHELRQIQSLSGGESLLSGAQPEIERRLARHPAAPALSPAPSRPALVRAMEEIGLMGASLYRDAKQSVSFTGELSSALLRAALSPRHVRWKDAFRVAETAGVDALPIVALIGFLMGLIMAFQSAIPMKQFGVEIFVADLISITMLKELGPLVTAIILAGRSGSAFAAELGTMKINEEIDALTTTGLDPVPFLAVTRVLGCATMAPALALFASLCGIAGGAIVLLSLGYPLTTYAEHVRSAVGLGEILAGLGKALVFGVIVGGIGCLRGLQTGTGASAVGAATTRAVVSGIILITIVDGVFAVIFYRLGI